MLIICIAHFVSVRFIVGCTLFHVTIATNYVELTSYIITIYVVRHDR